MFLSKPAIAAGCILGVGLSALKADDPSAYRGEVGKLSVGGKVIGTDARPLAGVTVWLRLPVKSQDYPEILAKTETDAQGQYSFRNVAVPSRWLSGSGSWLQIVAQKKDYGLAWHQWYFRHSLGPPPSVLRSEYRVRGRVVDIAGRPVSGVKIRVANMVAADPVEHIWLADSQIELSGTSNSNGEVILTGLPPQRLLQLDVADRRFALDSIFVATAKGFPDPPEGRALPGEFTHVLRRGRTLSGRVTSQVDGKPVLGARVFVGEIYSRFRAQTDVNGVFKIHQLSHDPWQILVYPSVASKLLPTVKVLEKDKEAAVALRSGRPLYGKVVDQNGRGVSHATVMKVDTTISTSAGRVILGGTQTDESGRFELTGSQGKNWLIVRPPGGYEEASDMLSSLEPLDPDKLVKRFPQFIQESDSSRETVFRLSRGMTISGRTLDGGGQPIAGAKISFDPAPFAYPELITDNFGKFRVSGFRPKSLVEVSAIHFGRHLVGRASVQSHGETKSVVTDISLVPHAIISGTVVDARGQGMAWVRVGVSRANAGRLVDDMLGVTTLTNERGLFSIDHLFPDATYSVYATTEGYTMSTLHNVKPSRSDVLRMVMHKGDLLIAGNLVDPAGKPRAGVRLFLHPSEPDVMLNGGHSTTDDQGRFRFVWLPPGEYSVSSSLNPEGWPNIPAGKQDVRLVLPMSAKEIR